VTTLRQATLSGSEPENVLRAAAVLWRRFLVAGGQATTSASGISSTAFFIAQLALYRLTVWRWFYSAFEPYVLFTSEHLPPPRWLYFFVHILLTSLAMLFSSAAVPSRAALWCNSTNGATYKRCVYGLNAYVTMESFAAITTALTTCLCLEHRLASYGCRNVTSTTRENSLPCFV